MSRSSHTNFVRLPAMMLAVVFCLLVQLAWGAVTGRISGTVKDPTGAVVPNAQLSVLEPSTGIKTDTKTDSAGFYSFPSLPVGHYEMEVKASGFRDFKQTGLILDVNTALTVDIPLQLGEASQEVTVNAAAVEVETTNTQMGEVINDTKMTTVPLNGRSYTDLLALQPGVTPVSSGQYGALSVSGDLNPGSLSVNGQRESANGFMVNGGNVEEGAWNGTSIIPSLDSIAEFRIITNNFDAEYGNYSGGQINAITKSGANEFHGDVFEFLRNTDLDARNFFDVSKGKFIQNQFGATTGGRIIRDKLFFFVDYQGTRQVIGQSTGLVPVPSAADRQGNLADVADQLTGTVTGGYWANQLSQKLGYTVTPGEPYYTPGCTQSTTCVFPNAVIPQSVITAPSQNLLKYIPAANNGAFYSTSSANETLHGDKGSFRLDYNSRFGMISGYYFIDNFNQDSPYVSASFPGFTATTLGRAQMANIADTKSFGPSAVNELRLHYVRMTNLGGFPGGGTGVTLDSLGFVTGPDTLGLVIQNKQYEGVPSVGFNNFSIGVPAYFAGQYNNTYQILDNFSKVKGTHTMKFGASVHYDQITEHDYGANDGTFGFDGQETGSDWADYLLGAPTSFQQGVQAPLHTRTYYYGLYAQDSWRMRSDLTLNYGLRYEVTSPWYEAQGQLETLVPGLQSKVFPGAPTGWVFPGDPGIPKSLAPVRHNNFGPRVGLAWSPSGKIFGGPGKTSIRASFGIFYTAFEDTTGFNEVGDAPFGYFWSNPAPPLFTTPYIDRQTGFVEGQRFPVNFPPSNVSASNPDNSINWAQFTPISSSPGFWYKNRVPYAEHYSLSLQRQFGSASVLSVSYVGTQGHALLSDLESNPGNPALCLGASQQSQVIPGGATCGPFGENNVITRADGTVLNGTRSPFSNALGSNGYFMTIGNSNYNSMQVSFRHRSGPLELLAAYTWSKSIDDSSGWGDQINVTNQRLGRVISSFDVPQNFVVSYHYDLPFDKLRRNRLTRGWVITGITRFSTGLPVTLRENDDNSLLGTFCTGPNCNEIDTPNYLGGSLKFHDPRSGLPYFDPSVFGSEALGQLGSAAKRMFHGPGINNWDMALLKDTHITESKLLQLRFEFFNIFNHAQFSNPTGSILNSTFGFVTNARDPRIGQVALKLLF
ncbi:MAG: TonB-dependent receptor [Acidobacteriia bacterium]|nr:TonB-dependent receptor [Terriglobia bacterium]